MDTHYYICAARINGKEIELSRSDHLTILINHIRFLMPFLMPVGLTTNPEKLEEGSEIRFTSNFSLCLQDSNGIDKIYKDPTIIIRKI